MAAAFFVGDFLVAVFLAGVDLEALNNNLSNSKVAAFSVRVRAHNNYRILGKPNNNRSHSNNNSSQPYSLGRATRGHSLVLHKRPLHYGRKGEV